MFYLPCEFCTKVLQSLRIGALFQKEFYGEYFKLTSFIKHERSLLSLRKCFLPKPMKSIYDKFISFFVCGFCRYEAFLDKCFRLSNKTGNANSSFWCILKTTSLKISLWNQYTIQGRLQKTRRHWFRTSRFLLVIWLKIELLMFWITQKYPCTSFESDTQRAISCFW